MDGPLSLQRLFQILRQSIIYRIHACPERVSAAVWNVRPVKHRPHGWLVAPRDIRMPDICHRFPRFVIFKDRHLGMFRYLIEKWMWWFKLAKLAGKANVAFRVQFLITKKDDLVSVKGRFNFREGALPNRLGQIHTVYLCPDYRV